jgi:hypothetical protein
MKVYFGQIYIEVGVSYGFSHYFQQWFGEQVSALVKSTERFETKYPDYEVMIRISAKSNITKAEVKGPTIFKKDKDVEFTIFLPFDPSHKDSLPLIPLIEGTINALETLGVDCSKLRLQKEVMISEIINNPLMIEG